MMKQEMIKNQVERLQEEIKMEQELRNKMAKMYGDFDTQTQLHENNIINLNNRISELMAEYWKSFSENN